MLVNVRGRSGAPPQYRSRDNLSDTSNTTWRATSRGRSRLPEVRTYVDCVCTVMYLYHKFIYCTLLGSVVF